MLSVYHLYFKQDRKPHEMKVHQNILDIQEELERSPNLGHTFRQFVPGKGKRTRALRDALQVLKQPAGADEDALTQTANTYFGSETDSANYARYVFSAHLYTAMEPEERGGDIQSAEHTPQQKKRSVRAANPALPVLLKANTPKITEESVGTTTQKVEEQPHAHPGEIPGSVYVKSTSAQGDVAVLPRATTTSRSKLQHYNKIIIGTTFVLLVALNLALANFTKRCFWGITALCTFVIPCIMLAVSYSHHTQLNHQHSADADELAAIEKEIESETEILNTIPVLLFGLGIIYTQYRSNADYISHTLPFLLLSIVFGSILPQLARHMVFDHKNLTRMFVVEEIIFSSIAIAFGLILISLIFPLYVQFFGLSTD